MNKLKVEPAQNYDMLFAQRYLAQEMGISRYAFWRFHRKALNTYQVSTEKFRIMGSDLIAYCDMLRKNPDYIYRRYQREK